MPRLHALLLACALAALPVRASAERSTEWSFENQALGAGWQIGGEPALTATREGLRIETRAASLFGRDPKLIHAADVLRIEYSAEEPVEGFIYWHERGRDAEDLTKVPLLFSVTEGMGTVATDMNRYGAWERRTDFVGIGLPPESAITIRRISLIGWNPVEKFAEGLRSFWTFDVVRPSSVNFLWGPHIAWNPIARGQLFRITPPQADSANWYLYGALLLGAGWAVYRAKRRPAAARAALLSFVALAAGMWLLYDLRMGAEFFAYAQRDYHTYWSREIGRRTFRERSFFNDFADSVAGLVADRREYIFVAPYRWPYLGLVRYHTYPALPAQPDDANIATVDTWVVYDRPDFTVNAKGELTSGGFAVSRPGTVLHEFDEGTFVFRTNP